MFHPFLHHDYLTTAPLYRISVCVPFCYRRMSVSWWGFLCHLLSSLVFLILSLYTCACLSIKVWQMQPYFSLSVLPIFSSTAGQFATLISIEFLSPITLSHIFLEMIALRPHWPLLCIHWGLPSGTWEQLNSVKVLPVYKVMEAFLHLPLYS